MKQIQLKLVTLLFFGFSFFIGNAYSSDVDLELNLLENDENNLCDLDFEDFAIFQAARNNQQVNLNNNQCVACANCVETFENFKEKFLNLVLFNTTLISELSNRNISILNIRQIGERFRAQFLQALKCYKPSLQQSPLRQITNSTRNINDNAIRLFAVDLFVNHQQTARNRKRVKQNFTKLTNILQKFIVDLDGYNLKVEFNRAIDLRYKLETLPLDRVRQNFPAYQALLQTNARLVTIIENLR